MKYSLFWGLINLFFFTISFGQTVSSQLSCSNKVFDFGDIVEKDGKVYNTFIFKNTGKSSVIISGVFAGCGCTSSQYTKEIIMPGKTGAVKVSFNPAHLSGSFSKEITVLFNENKNYTRIWVKGNVIPSLRDVKEDHPYYLGKGLYTSLQVLAFGTIERAKHKEITLFYANGTAKDMDMCFLVDGEHESISFKNPSKLPPNGRGKIIFRYTSLSKQRGTKTFKIYPFVDGVKLSKPITVRVNDM